MKGLSGGAPLIPTLLHHLPSSPLPSLAPSPLARLLSPTPLYQSSSLSPSNLPPSPPPPLLSTPPHSPFSSFFSFIPPSLLDLETLRTHVTVKFQERRCISRSLCLFIEVSWRSILVSRKTLFIAFILSSLCLLKYIMDNVSF